jgi:membrane protein
MGKLHTIKDFILEVYKIWISEKPDQLAAALAYYGVFSFAAVIFIAYALAGIVINGAAAAELLYTRIGAVLGPEIESFIRESVSAISTFNENGSWIISVVSLGSLLFAAMGLFLQVKYAMNRIWGVPLIPQGKKLVFARQQLFAFIMVIAFALLVILATVINVVFALFGSIINEYIGQSQLLSLLNGLALLGLVALTNALIYKVLPDVKLAWRDVWLGSVAAALLMAIGGLVFGLYFRLGGVHSAFQAAGAFAVLMIAIYYFAQIFLFGAVITRVYAHRFGSMRTKEKTNENV